MQTLICSLHAKKNACQLNFQFRFCHFCTHENCVRRWRAVPKKHAEKLQPNRCSSLLMASFAPFALTDFVFHVSKSPCRQADRFDTLRELSASSRVLVRLYFARTYRQAEIVDFMADCHPKKTKNAATAAHRIFDRQKTARDRMPLLIGGAKIIEQSDDARVARVCKHFVHEWPRLKKMQRSLAHRLQAFRRSTDSFLTLLPKIQTHIVTEFYVCKKVSATKLHNKRKKSAQK